MPQTVILLNYLKSVRLRDPEGGWVVSHQLEKVNTPYGWLGTAALRRARELVERGNVEKRRNGKYVEYRFALENETVEFLKYKKPQIEGRKLSYKDIITANND